MPSVWQPWNVTRSVAVTASARSRFSGTGTSAWSK